MTDTSACGRTEFHILWCRDCVSLIRSRFREQVFDQVSTFGFGLRRSYGKKKEIHKSFLVVIVGRRVVSPGKMHIPRCRHFPMQKRPGLQSSPSTILQQNFRF